MELTSACPLCLAGYTLTFVRPSSRLDQMPHLSEVQREAVRSASQDTACLRASVKHTEAGFAAVMDRLRYSLRYSEVRQAAICNSTNPAIILPIEILSNIMQWCHTLSMRDKDLPRMEVVLSHVCSHWRDVAISTWGLWCRLDGPQALGLTSISESRLEEYLVRSKGGLLDIDVGIPRSDRRPADFIHVLQLLVAHSTRWRSLRISDGTDGASLWGGYSQLGDMLKDLAVPQLTTIDLDLHFSTIASDGSVEAFKPNILLGGAPRLHDIRIVLQYSQCFLPPLSNATSLSLDTYEHGMGTRPNIFPILKLFTLARLRNLSLTTGVSIMSCFTKPSQPMVGDALHTLQLDQRLYSLFHQPEALLPPLVFRGLRCLRIPHLSSWPESPVVLNDECDLLPGLEVLFVEATEDQIMTPHYLTCLTRHINTLIVLRGWLNAPATAWPNLRKIRFGSHHQRPNASVTAKHIKLVYLEPLILRGEALGGAKAANQPSEGGEGGLVFGVDEVLMQRLQVAPRNFNKLTKAMRVVEVCSEVVEGYAWPSGSGSGSGFPLELF